MIFVDETLIQIDCKDYWPWIAYEPNMDLCLTVHIYQEKELSSYVINSSKNYGVDLAEENSFTDGARWYNDACKWLRWKHQVYGTELKNIMERFIQKIKDRTQNVLITFHVDQKVVINRMLPIGSKCLFSIYI
jgi:transposase-like protein